MTDRCTDCDRDYVAPAAWRRVRQCPRCAAREDVADRVAAGSLVELPPRRFARHVLQERLGVTGNQDS